MNKIRTGGGDGGDFEAPSAVPASWTYTVTSLEGAELGTGVSPERPRPDVELLAGGPFGVAFYDETGTLRLWDAGEVADYSECPEG